MTDDSAWTCPHCGHEVAVPAAVCDACGTDYREPLEEAYVHRPVSEEYDRADVSPSRRALLAGAGGVAALAGLGTAAYAAGAFDYGFAGDPPVAHRAQLVSEFENHGDLSANAIDSVEGGETACVAFEYSHDSLNESRTAETGVKVTPVHGDWVTFERADADASPTIKGDQRVQSAVRIDTSLWESGPYDVTVTVRYQGTDSTTTRFDVT